MSSHSDPDDFDIAKTIVSQVKDLPLERKERIFRWVAESVGLASLTPRPAQAAPAHPAAPLSQPFESPAPGAGGGRDIKTFIAAKEPKGDTQFAAAVAYYHRFEAPAAQRRDTVNANLLQEATRLAGRTWIGTGIGPNAKRVDRIRSRALHGATFGRVAERLLDIGSLG